MTLRALLVGAVLAWAAFPPGARAAEPPVAAFEGELMFPGVKGWTSRQRKPDYFEIHGPMMEYSLSMDRGGAERLVQTFGKGIKKISTGFFPSATQNYISQRRCRTTGGGSQKLPNGWVLVSKTFRCPTPKRRVVEMGGHAQDLLGVLDAGEAGLYVVLCTYYTERNKELMLTWLGRGRRGPGGLVSGPQKPVEEPAASPSEPPPSGDSGGGVKTADGSLEFRPPAGYTRGEPPPGASLVLQSPDMGALFLMRHDAERMDIGELRSLSARLMEKTRTGLVSKGMSCDPAETVLKGLANGWPSMAMTAVCQLQGHPTQVTSIAMQTAHGIYTAGGTGIPPETVLRILGTGRILGEPAVRKKRPGAAPTKRPAGALTGVGGDSRFGRLAAMGAIVLFLAAVAYWVLGRGGRVIRLQTTRRRRANAPDGLTVEMAKYIVGLRGKFPDEAIRRNLRKDGYTSDQVTRAFRLVYSQSKSRPDKKRS